MRDAIEHYGLAIAMAVLTFVFFGFALMATEWESVLTGIAMSALIAFIGGASTAVITDYT